MRSLALLALCVASSAFLVPPQSQQQAVITSNDQRTLETERYLIDLGAGDVRWVTEDEKWALKRNGQNFMDITATPFHTSDSPSVNSVKPIDFPKNTSYSATVKPLAKGLKEENMRENLEKFTSFHTRYYKSDYGIESATWLLGRVNDTIHESGADEYGATVEKFEHPWGQFSIIARFPGKSEKTVVIGAHQDSINMFFPSLLSAPGADDDGSGTVTILEAMRVLLKSKDVVKGKARNTVEFHWYSAEEGGLLGSQAIFGEYRKQGRDVKAMLQQDMTGYVQRTLDAGKPESVGVITDFVDEGLTEFIKEVITEYCDIPFVLTKCGYACSDHASASKNGYPSAFVIESEFRLSDQKIHTSDDKIEYLSFSHMLQHAKLTLGLSFELAFAKLD